MTEKFKIHAATRVGVTPLIGLYSESGCGKTYSSLLLARGLAGPDGKIVMLDTESGRGSLYADVIPGGYDVVDLEAPYNPGRYREAIDFARSQKPAVIIVDSMSHEWEGVGGVLDMAGENEARSGKPGLHNWKTPKMEHTKLMLELLRCNVPMVCCIRAKYKSRQIKDDKGRTAIVKDDHTSPIQSEDFIFEMTAHAEIMQDHSVHVTKCSHPDLRACFPVKGKPITVEHGEALAAWCAAGAAPRFDKDGWLAVCKADVRLQDAIKALEWTTKTVRELWKTTAGDAATFAANIKTAHAKAFDAPQDDEELPLEG